MTVRVAMWSGPRNISTAMMRAWENRPDCAVSDEPFYAAYLAATGLDHPLRDAVIASQPANWQDVAAALDGPAPDDAAVWYQKHMAHHMLPGFGVEWASSCRNVFLLRPPEEVLASYVVRRAEVTLEDIGVVRQAELYDEIATLTGEAPIVIEAEQVLANPRRALAALCERLGVPFAEEMLRWPAGKRPSDGVWAPAWYDVVERSTGFAPPRRTKHPPLPPELAAIADEARPHYQRLLRHRMAI